MTAAVHVDTPHLGRGMPAWFLRVAVLLAGAFVVAIPFADGALLGTLFVLCPLAVIAVYAPASPAPSGLVIAAAVMAALTGDDPLRPAVLVMIPAVHLFHVTCGLAGLVPVRGRLHPRALVRPALRFLLVEAIVFAFVGIAALLPATQIPAPIEVAALAGLVVVAVVILLWHRGVFRQPGPRGRDDSHTGGGGR
ncbi:MAG TPA: hypothetical protein VGP26_01475 [Actinophytocola sp.]|jgi:hypothetical protein|nr:hypothetical protein [Actinophytocola sp.]